MKSSKSYRSFRSIQWAKTRAYRNAKDEALSDIDAGLEDWFLPEPDAVVTEYHRYNPIHYDMESWIEGYDGRDRSNRNSCPCCWDHFHFGLNNLNGSQVCYELVTLLALDKGGSIEELIKRYRPDADSLKKEYARFAYQLAPVPSREFKVNLTEADKRVIRWYENLRSQTPEYFLQQFSEQSKELAAFSKIRSQIERLFWKNPYSENLNGSDIYYEAERAAILALVTFPMWQNPLSSWKGDTAIDLLKHLLPIEAEGGALYTSLMNEHYADRNMLSLDESTNALDWTKQTVDPLLVLSALTQGASVRRVASYFGLQLPKKYLSTLLSLAHIDYEPYRDSLTTLLQQCNIYYLGGTNQDWERLTHINYIHPSDLQEEYMQKEYFLFWQSTAMFLIKWHDALTDTQATRIVSWGLHHFTENRKFSFSNRTLKRVMDNVEAYEYDIEQRLLAKKSGGSTWEKQGWDLEWQDNESVQWKVRELNTQLQLAQEGVAQSHCVGGYVNYCIDGISAILQLLKEGERHLTIEVSLPERHIRQARGRFNMAPDKSASLAVEHWADYFGIHYSN